MGLFDDRLKQARHEQDAIRRASEQAGEQQARAHEEACRPVREAAERLVPEFERAVAALRAGGIHSSTDEVRNHTKVKTKQGVTKGKPKPDGWRICSFVRVPIRGPVGFGSSVMKPGMSLADLVQRGLIVEGRSRIDGGSHEFTYRADEVLDQAISAIATYLASPPIR